ncbi:related to thioredoxin [Cephalotrichum gorgonifer]|uniref:Related to thioredoxin n=1 Tax=Cephalotrichum gorgonifer TaxID=2041049 RepID=A0AAE8MUT6_9PEZI|nr:related to thioredoxin [Cephalotrichum gorgonifer]
MDVHLLVYDLSQGLARNMSMGILGFQVDAIYHTSIELNGREYVYDGGIVDIVPGSSHLGRPLERLYLGKTELPLDVIDEYLDSLRPIFTAEAYDLFRHNCNNFTDSFATFLVGKGIPDHILNLPQAVLDSPMGRMLLPHLTQNVNAARQTGSILGIQNNNGAAPVSNGQERRGHPHQQLNLPTFVNAPKEPVVYSKTPPIPKLLAKMGSAAQDPAVADLKTFIEARDTSGAANATLPDVKRVALFVQQSVRSLPLEVLFSVVDLFRCALVDPRISAFFAEEKNHETISSVLEVVLEAASCPYALRLVTLQMACNLFTSPLYADEILSTEAQRVQIVRLISSSFLDDAHTNTRVAAASLMFNLILAHRRVRDGKHPHGNPLPEADQIELAASALEAIQQEEESAEALHGMLAALGHLVYGSPVDGELADLLRTLEAQATVVGKKGFPEEKLIQEVGSELLGKGFGTP